MTPVNHKAVLVASVGAVLITVGLAVRFSLLTLTAPAPSQNPDPVATAPSHPSADPQPAPEPVGKATAVFAGGCFWCTEAAFEQLLGVEDVVSGYTGGTRKTAHYRWVSRGHTGHAEAIRVTYDPEQITYDQLLDVFFNSHDPTEVDRQGHDVGTQYRSAIFYANDVQKQAAEAKIRQLNDSKVFPSPIATTLEPLAAFYLAEDDHQDYARRSPDQPYIQFVSDPKVAKVREKHPDLVRQQVAE
jgi:methionine-S-sulfoxide reductase